MIKNIILKMDEKFFYKMSADKAKREQKRNIKLTWEDYVKLLFGLASYK